MQEHKNIIKDMVDLMEKHKINYVKMTIDKTEKFEINITDAGSKIIQKLA